MHAPIHLVIATESDRIRREDAAKARSHASDRNRFAAIVARVSPRARARAAAHGIPPRAAPGTESPSLGRPRAAPFRGR
jgi:hypothetical protein